MVTINFKLLGLDGILGGVKGKTIDGSMLTPYFEHKKTEV